MGWLSFMQLNSYQMEWEKIFQIECIIFVFKTHIIAVGIYCDYSANFRFGLRPNNAVRTAGTNCWAISSNRDSSVLQIFILFLCANNSIPPHVWADKNESVSNFSSTSLLDAVLYSAATSSTNSSTTDKSTSRTRNVTFFSNN